MITIKKDKVIFQEYNEEVKDITDELPCYLMEKCQLDDDITLKEVFLLIEKDIDIFKVIIGNWCKEIITEGLYNNSKPYSNEYDKDEIEYLELYRYYNIDEPESFGCIHFHGMGYELQEEHDHFLKGERIPWSLSMTKSNDIINIPLRLNNNIKIYDDDYKVIRENCDETSLYGLIDILYCVIWELSFHGAPKDRDDVKEELDRRVKKYFDAVGNIIEE
jgi:hypothetical protein